MYVCICRNINDQKIRDFVKNNKDICRTDSIGKIYNAISGKKPNCGKCLPVFKEIIQDELGNTKKAQKELFYKVGK